MAVCALLTWTLQWVDLLCCVIAHSWWRHQMETFSALLALSVGNSPVPVNSPHKGQWRGVLMFSLIYAWIDQRINGWVNNREAGDLRRHRGHYDVNVMSAYHTHIPLLTSILTWCQQFSSTKYSYSYMIILRIWKLDSRKCAICAVMLKCNHGTNHIGERISWVIRPISFQQRFFM